MNLTDQEKSSLRKTISDARGGRASLLDLAKAHHLADQGRLPGCAAELRAHIRAAATNHADRASSARRDVFMGVVSGVLTHVLLGGILK